MAAGRATGLRSENVTTAKSRATARTREGVEPDRGATRSSGGPDVDRGTYVDRGEMPPLEFRTFEDIANAYQKYGKFSGIAGLIDMLRQTIGSDIKAGVEFPGQTGSWRAENYDRSGSGQKLIDMLSNLGQIGISPLEEARPFIPPAPVPQSVGFLNQQPKIGNYSGLINTLKQLTR